MDRVKLSALLILLGVLAGCAMPYHEPPYEDDTDASASLTQPARENPQPLITQQEQRLPVVLRAEGYGVLAPQPHLTVQQQRLLAMKASRIDAYRAMAERVHGLYLQSYTQMDNLQISRDELIGQLDHVLQGARVIVMREVSEGLFETQIELVIDPDQGIVID